MHFDNCSIELPRARGPPKQFSWFDSQSGRDVTQGGHGWRFVSTFNSANIAGAEARKISKLFLR